MRCEEVMAKLEELSPLMYASEWDNVGLQTGRRDKEVRRIYIALDATDEVIEDAVKKRADMLLTHHPMIFKPVRKITGEHFVGRRIIKLIQNDMCYYAMHTNFDVMGMADAAADEIGLKSRTVLETTFEDEISKEGFGRIGKLPAVMSLRECAELVKQKFGIDYVKVFGDLEADLETAAIMPGSGKSMITAAIEGGADVMITGDIDHHEGMDGAAQGLFIIDAGHFGLEQIFVPYMEEYLIRECKEIEVIAPRQAAPFVII
ncbi:MAG: Nif3-like dinuclear metal center hexameric protein [Lachnospiraceae bacterium]|nr:Nif3-like dinuclear metal center hexameric protein [Lachnospiraceae bacterium]